MANLETDRAVRGGPDWKDHLDAVLLYHICSVRIRRAVMGRSFADSKKSECKLAVAQPSRSDARRYSEAFLIAYPRYLLLLP